jgi:hypothetical protein
MRILIALLTLLVSTSVFAEAGCIAVTKEKLCIQMEWVEGPYVGAYSKNIVRFKDLKVSTDDITVYKSPSESLQFFGWMIMASHEHGTRPVKTKILEEGVYENTKIFYMGGMMGTWQFKVKVGKDNFVLHALDV